MSRSRYESRSLAVPSRRLSRLSRFGAMAGGVMGNMLVDGAKQLAGGKRPRIEDLLLTPANALRVTHQLAHLRGAAMKLGQLMSMDSGDMLPAELAGILAHLRSDAHHMPQAQLHAMLGLRWGKDWQTRFARFDFQPIAAASIGQVHRACTHDGQELAIKIQYPGVRQSINSDVANVASLLRISGLLPKEIEISGLLEEAKRQLHDEADYEREALYLTRFADLMQGDPHFAVPTVFPEFGQRDILAMGYLQGQPIEDLANAPQAERDRVTALLFDLVLRELFVFGVMQTDPNFANYHYDPDTGRIILLDFGASRDIPSEISGAYRALMTAGLDRDIPAALQAAFDAGLINPSVADKHGGALDAMFDLAMAALADDAPYDFGDSALVNRLREDGMAIAADRSTWHVPPTDMLFTQRKLGGIFLLASRLKARVNVRALMERYRGEAPTKRKARRKPLTA